MDRAVERIVKTLRVFQNTIDLFMGSPFLDNLVLGGSASLVLHGLEFREIQDVDIIIYNPTPEQIRVFESLILLSSPSIEYSNKEYGPVRRVLKLSKNGLNLDIILERESTMDYTLLRASINGVIWFIQSVREVVKAKTEYSREKDLQDLLYLKNNNFKRW